MKVTKSKATLAICILSPVLLAASPLLRYCVPAPYNASYIADRVHNEEEKRPNYYDEIPYDSGTDELRMSQQELDSRWQGVRKKMATYSNTQGTDNAFKLVKAQFSGDTKGFAPTYARHEIGLGGSVWVVEGASRQLVPLCMSGTTRAMYLSHMRSITSYQTVVLSDAPPYRILLKKTHFAERE